MPELERHIDPATDQVVADSTQISEKKKIYTVPFSKEKVNELSEYFTEAVNFIVVDRGAQGRRYTCTLQLQLPERKSLALKSLNS